MARIYFLPAARCFKLLLSSRCYQTFHPRLPPPRLQPSPTAPMASRAAETELRRSRHQQWSACPVFLLEPGPKSAAGHARMPVLQSCLVRCACFHSKSRIAGLPLTTSHINPISFCIAATSESIFRCQLRGPSTTPLSVLSEHFAGSMRPNRQSYCTSGLLAATAEMKDNCPDLPHPDLPRSPAGLCAGPGSWRS